MTTFTRSFTINFDSDSVGVGYTSVPVTTAWMSVSTSAVGGSTISTSISQSRTATASTSATAFSSTTASSHHSGLSTGQIIGIIVGAVVAATLLTLLLFCVCRKRKRQLAKQTFQTRNTFAEQQSRSKRNSVQSLRNQASRLSQIPARASRHIRWPENLVSGNNTASVAPANHRRSANMGRSAGMRSGVLLPISQPIPEERPEILPTFQERFFAAPPSARTSEPISQRHPSDATTIRTSGHPSTPNRPVISLLRLQSTRTSKGTTFEEDKNSEDDHVPPLPTFTAVAIPPRSTATTSELESPTRSTLEAGIKRSISKAISHLPLAHVHQHQIGTSSNRPNFGGSKDNSHPGFGDVGFGRKSKITAMQRSVYPTIPERSSSLHGYGSNSDEELLLRRNNTTASCPQHSGKLRSPPLVLEPSSEQSIRNITYPRVPVSASEAYRHQVSSSLQSPFDPWSQTQPTPSEPNEKCSKKALPPVAGTEELPVEPVRNSHIVRQFKLPSRIYIPTNNRNALHNLSVSDAFPPQAILTPNRTNTGDLVLTVDMK